MKDDSLRPIHLVDYIGQDHIREPLAAALYSAKQRGKPLPHALFSGPPGLGKTTLAMIVANEMEWALEDVIGSVAGNPLTLARSFLHMKANTMFFIDEIHALRKPVQEVLYPVLEDNRLLVRWSGGVDGEYQLKPITILGATTDLGKLAQPFIDRFPIQFELSFYEPDELAIIGKNSAEKMEVTIAPDGLEEIANRSRGTPRYVNTYVKWVRDFVLYQHASPVVDEDYVKMIMWQKLKVDNAGLRPLERNYLRTLRDAGVVVGVDALASKLRQAVVTLENTVEPFLMYAGMVERLKGGRLITDKGKAHLANLRRNNGKSSV